MKPVKSVLIVCGIILVIFIIKALPQWGVDVNMANEQGWTLLHSAARDGDVAVTNMLLGQGADVNAETTDGETPLDVAKRTGHTEVADILREHGGL